MPRAKRKPTEAETAEEAMIDQLVEEQVEDEVEAAPEETPEPEGTDATPEPAGEPGSPAPEEPQPAAAAEAVSPAADIDTMSAEELRAKLAEERDEWHRRERGRVEEIRRWRDRAETAPIPQAPVQQAQPEAEPSKDMWELMDRPEQFREMVRREARQALKPTTADLAKQHYTERRNALAAEAPEAAKRGEEALQFAGNLVVNSGLLTSSNAFELHSGMVESGTMQQLTRVYPELKGREGDLVDVLMAATPWSVDRYFGAFGQPKGQEAATPVTELKTPGGRSPTERGVSGSRAQTDEQRLNELTDMDVEMISDDEHQEMLRLLKRLEGRRR